jgi:transcriptional regulator with XRE-family HTH domain
MNIHNNEDDVSLRWLQHMAGLEDESPSLAVGGLAHDLGVAAGQDSAAIPVIRSAFGRLIEFWRRENKLSTAQLAERAGVELEELVIIQQGTRAPSPRTVFRLAEVLGVPVEKLNQMAGLMQPRDQKLTQAATKFAASSGSMAALSAEEHKALQDMLHVLAR